MQAASLGPVAYWQPPVADDSRPTIGGERSGSARKQLERDKAFALHASQNRVPFDAPGEVRRLLSFTTMSHESFAPTPRELALELLSERERV
jgi:hypothetical protein